MNILVTNDDGIHAVGIQKLVKVLEKKHYVMVVAPNTQRSASSHSITLESPIIVKQEEIHGIESECYSVSGTPVDCSKIALTTLAKKKIDIVVSGINDGFNLGTDVLYSGTVSAAVEGAINKVPAIALSCDGKEESYEIALECIESVLEKIKNYDLGNTVLNINIPGVGKEQLEGIKVCGIGERSYNNVYIEIGNEDGGSIYKITGSPQPPKEDNTDVAYIAEGYITITPMHYDLTDDKLICKLSNILE